MGGIIKYGYQCLTWRTYRHIGNTYRHNGICNPAYQLFWCFKCAPSRLQGRYPVIQAGAFSQQLRLSKGSESFRIFSTASKVAADPLLILKGPFLGFREEGLEGFLGFRVLLQSLGFRLGFSIGFRDHRKKTPKPDSLFLGNPSWTPSPKLLNPLNTELEPSLSSIPDKP